MGGSSESASSPSLSPLNRFLRLCDGLPATAYTWTITCARSTTALCDWGQSDHAPVGTWSAGDERLDQQPFPFDRDPAQSVRQSIHVAQGATLAIIRPHLTEQFFDHRQIASYICPGRRRAWMVVRLWDSSENRVRSGRDPSKRLRGAPTGDSAGDMSRECIRFFSPPR